jgi:hypothetical protein
MLFLRRLPRLTVGLIVSAAALECGGGESIGPPPGPGTLQVTTSTSGVEHDVDGYSVQIDGDPIQAIGTAATITETEVTPGPHTVQLGEVAANCTVSGDNPQRVTVGSGQTTTVTFAVTCNPTTGSLSISIDGADRGALAVNGTVTISGLAPGNHLVGLTGVAANCQVQGDNARTVSVTAGANTSVAYTIICAAPPPGAGSLRIITNTSGPDADADGYTFRVDGGASQPIGVNAPTTLTNLAAGAHSVELGGIAANCAR